MRSSRCWTGNSFRSRCEHAGVELGNVQQCVEELVHCGNGGIDPLDNVIAVRRIERRAQLRNEEAQRMQRLAQVMACGREKAGLGQIGQFELVRALLDLALQRCIGALELLRHAVELLAQGL